MKLTFTNRAGRDLARLREFLNQKNPQAARRASQQLSENIRSLLKHPKLGTALTVPGDYRELVARDYIVRYRLVENEIVILNVWHGREDH